MGNYEWKQWEDFKKLHGQEFVDDLKALFKIKEEGGTFENTKNKTERK